ncbi:MAG: hypothetical protein AB1512_05940 [Thermodesulfobacteriota bacterium]
MIQGLPDFYHIGFHKTGTTFLQVEVFGRHPGILVRKTPEYFLDDVLLTKGPGYYKALFQGDQKGAKIVETSEGLSGDMFGLGRYRRIAAGIKEVDPDAKVIVFLRNQPAMIESLYKQYIKERGVLPFNGFIASEIGDKVLEKVRYIEQVRFYKELFGKNLWVFLYEEMARDMKGFFSRFYEIIGIEPFAPEMKKHNRGATVLTGVLYRRLNMLCHSNPSVNCHRRKLRHVLDFLDHNLIKHVDKRKYMNEPMRRELAARFSESNRDLGKLIERDLSKYGYPVAG